jgi:threonine dehydrogenase-like Zn-dependent dehydrogenase
MATQKKKRASSQELRTKTYPSSIEVAKLARVSQSAVSRTFTGGTSVSERTRKKFMDRLKESGITDIKTAPGDFRYEGGYQSALDLMRQNRPPQAIFCANDIMAIGAIDALRSEAGVLHFVDVGSVELNPHRHICAKNIRLIGQTNFAYTGIIPSVKLLTANRDKYDFTKIVTHRYDFRKAEEALLMSMGLDSMKVITTGE